jgi:hypothetical protein
MAGIIWNVEAFPTPETKKRNRNVAKKAGQLPMLRE